jgi:threonine dehydratase
MQNLNPKIKMIASEPKNANDCARSFAAGKRLANETPPDTICDALK